MITVLNKGYSHRPQRTDLTVKNRVVIERKTKSWYRRDTEELGKTIDLPLKSGRISFFDKISLLKET